MRVLTLWSSRASWRVMYKEDAYLVVLERLLEGAYLVVLEGLLEGDVQ